MENSTRVVVIGAGISGLTAAWWLHNAGLDVTVLEKDSSVGGTMRTVRDGGWLIETGPNSALETTPLFNQLFAELGITGDRVYADASSDKRYILRDGKLHVLPLSPGAFITSPLWSVGGKLRLLKELFIGRATKEETIAEFVERRLGREFLDYAINPFVAGVYAGNPEQLSVRAAFPKLYALEEEYGGLIKGMIKGRKERKQRSETSKDRARMFSFKEGMQALPSAIGRRLGERLKLSCEVKSIIKTTLNGNDARKGFLVTYLANGETKQLNADVVIVGVPAYAASELLKTMDVSLAQTLQDIYYPPVAEVFLGFREDQFTASLDGFGYLIPAKEKRKILGTIWSSSIFSNRAPHGHVALTTFVGGARQPELVNNEDNDLISLVVEEIQSIMGLRGGPVYSKVIRWSKAIPQYNIGYDAVTSAIDRFETSMPGLYLCGNYRGGIAVGDCVMSGKKTADRILGSYQTKNKSDTETIRTTSINNVS
jgi:oxygen-dependent protoporphyrinogen oxidase